MQARAAVKGTGLRNSAFPYVAEYIERQRLAKLGFVSSIRDLDAEKAEIFAIISQEIDKTQSEEINKKAAKNGRR